MFWFGDKILPKVTYFTLNKHFNKKNISKNFNEFIIIDKIFKEFNLDNKIKYYF